VKQSLATSREICSSIFERTRSSEQPSDTLQLTGVPGGETPSISYNVQLRL